MRQKQYIALKKFYSKLPFSAKKNEYSQVRFLMNTQYGTDVHNTSSYPAVTYSASYERKTFPKKMNCILLRLFSFHYQHPVSDADMRLDILRRIRIRFNLLAKRRHKDAQRSDVVFPTAAPDALRDKGVCQHLADVS